MALKALKGTITDTVKDTVVRLVALGLIESYDDAMAQLVEHDEDPSAKKPKTRKQKEIIPIWTANSIVSGKCSALTGECWYVCNENKKDDEEFCTACIRKGGGKHGVASNRTTFEYTSPGGKPAKPFNETIAFKKLLAGGKTPEEIRLNFETMALRIEKEIPPENWVKSSGNSKAARKGRGKQTETVSCSSIDELMKGTARDSGTKKKTDDDEDDDEDTEDDDEDDSEKHEDEEESLSDVLRKWCVFVIIVSSSTPLHCVCTYRNKERDDADEAERLEAERKAERKKVEAERLEAERKAERLEAERLEAERKKVKEAERLEAERKKVEEAERLEAERKKVEEAERLEAERKKVEAERLEAERKKVEAERLEAERKKVEEAERLKAEKKELKRKRAEEREAEIEKMRKLIAEKANQGDDSDDSDDELIEEKTE